MYTIYIIYENIELKRYLIPGTQIFKQELIFEFRIASVYFCGPYNTIHFRVNWRLK